MSEGTTKSIIESLRATDSWVRKSKCIGVDAELFFAPLDSEEGRLAAEVAKSICNGEDGEPACSVREECLNYSIEHGEKVGVWGGLDEAQRRRVVRDLRAKRKRQEEARREAAEEAERERRRVIRRRQEVRWV